MAKVTNGLQKLEPSLDFIIQSPLLRAQQTADILNEFYPAAQRETSKNLSPGHSAQALFTEIHKRLDLDSIALVGHEPDLGLFLSWILHRKASNRYRFKKGGVAKIDIYDDGQRFLKWFIGPKFLLEI